MFLYLRVSFHKLGFREGGMGWRPGVSIGGGWGGWGGGGGGGGGVGWGFDRGLVKGTVSGEIFSLGGSPLRNTRPPPLTRRKTSWGVGSDVHVLRRSFPFFHGVRANKMLLQVAFAGEVHRRGKHSISLPSIQGEKMMLKRRV